MKVYRSLRHETKEFIYEGSEKECRMAIVKDYTDRGEKSYYWNYYSPEEGTTVVDYGSWSVFYYLVD